MQRIGAAARSPFPLSTCPSSTPERGVVVVETQLARSCDGIVWLSHPPNQESLPERGTPSMHCGPADKAKTRHRLPAGPTRSQLSRARTEHVRATARRCHKQTK